MKNLNKNNKNTTRASVATLIFLAMSGCMGDCKSMIKPPNPNLDPLPLGKVEPPLMGVDPLLAEQWALKKVQLPEAWQSLGGSGSRRVTVAVLGSGVDYNHEDLRTNILLNEKEMSVAPPGKSDPTDEKDNDDNGYVDDFAGWDVVESDGLPFDRTGTGTAAAGIIGAVHDNGKGIKGVTPLVSLIPVRYIGTNGETNIARLIEGLRYAKARHADIVYVHLANMEFTGGLESVPGKTEALGLEKVLREIEAMNSLVVVSAGNTGSKLGETKGVVRLFSEMSNVIVVTSSDQEDRRPFIANFGVDVVDTAAPGEGIRVTLPMNQYGLESGTFAAAAHVAGALALGLGKVYGKIPHAKLVQAILSEEGSDSVDSMKYETAGGNRLNVSKFLGTLD